MTPWTIAYQVSLSLGFPRKQYWSGLLFPSPGDLPDPRIEPASVFCIAGSLLHWQASSLSLSQQESTKCPYAELKSFSSVQFSHSVMSDSLRPHESQHTRPPCPSPTPGVHSDSRPSSQVMPSSHLVFISLIIIQLLSHISYHILQSPTFSISAPFSFLF